MSFGRENKTLKEMSEYYLGEKARIKRMQDELAMLRNYAPPAAKMTGMPAAHSEPGDPTSAILEKCEDLEEKIAWAEKELEPLYMAMCYTIAHSIDKEDDRSIVYHRLVLNEPYKAIAAHVICSAAHARNVVSKWSGEIAVS